jgi:hypothetical protein
MAQIPCPYVYPSGERCTGYIVRIEAYQAELAWSFQTDGTRKFQAGQPRSHYHLFCSESGSHGGESGSEAEAMKVWHLPDGVEGT